MRATFYLCFASKYIPMGQCCSLPPSDPSVRTVLALKFPHGMQGTEWRRDRFVAVANVQQCLHELYENQTWKSWMIYNDEVKQSVHTSRGHCKGIVTWNEHRIGWLVHSVPLYPAAFDGTLPSIPDAQQIYGQSFQYVEMPYQSDLIRNIAYQLHIMEANVYLQQGETFKTFPQCRTVRRLPLSDTIQHIAKSPHYEFDLYSDILKPEYQWWVQSWIRGHHVQESDRVKNLKGSQFGTHVVMQSQDHSKWAVSNADLYWVGDLNRMTSQFKRGGGGFLIQRSECSSALRSAMIVHDRRVSTVTASI